MILELSSNEIFEEQIISCADEESVAFFGEENSNQDIILSEVSLPFNLHINLENNAYLMLKILSTWKENDLDSKLKITGDIKENAKLELVLADFTNSDSEVSVDIDLNGRNASAEVHIAGLGFDNTDKNFNVNINHNFENTSSNLETFGVAKGKSNIKVDAISYIKQNCNKSIASQDCKIILFDDVSKGKAKPILKIDCNDVKAKHACAVGSLKDEHLYYLLSRGIDKVEARKLLTLGYLIPISKYFKNEAFIDKINDLIGGSF